MYVFQGTTVPPTANPISASTITSSTSSTKKVRGSKRGKFLLSVLLFNKVHPEFKYSFSYNTTIDKKYGCDICHKIYTIKVALCNKNTSTKTVHASLQVYRLRQHCMRLLQINVDAACFGSSVYLLSVLGIPNSALLVLFCIKNVFSVLFMSKIRGLLKSPKFVKLVHYCIANHVNLHSLIESRVQVSRSIFSYNTFQGKWVCGGL